MATPDRRTLHNVLVLKRISAPAAPTTETPPSVPVPDAILRELEDAVLTGQQPATAARRKPPLSTADLVPLRIDPATVWARSGRTRTSPPRQHGTLWSATAMIPWFVGAGVVIAVLLYVSQYGLRIKGRVIQQGNAAMISLMAAKDNLERMDLDAAQRDFTTAADRFAQAQQELGIIGPGLLRVIANIPGAGSLRAAQHLVQAGQLISDAGLAASDAAKALTHSGALLDGTQDGQAAFAEVFRPLQEALERAHSDLVSADRLLADIDTEALPADVRAQFAEFRQRLPQVLQFIGSGKDAVSFLSSFSGVDRPRRYLLLFQNSAELRPTGGFPGSYGVVTFENGRVKEFHADDVYNPDGQIRDLVVPPLQLQHITPSWGMRDANWFVDFPASARKVMEYWQRGGGSAVDGVLAIRPEVLAGILKLTGPISLPQYDMVLNADNVLTTLQQEVETKKDAAQPKQIIVDLAPQILQRLASAPATQWALLLSLFRQGLAQRDIMAYFTDEALQGFAVRQGWDGRVVQTDGDYLMVNISNIKGAKADAVTDTTEKLESWLDGGTMVHRLTLTRSHNGGKSAFGFYNKPNHSWVRVLVPEGSVLRGIAGNDRPAYAAMVDYNREPNAIRDADLVKLESTYQRDQSRGTITYQESGKTGFGFWMSVDPGATATVQLEYAVPARAAASDYRLYVQRQPGLDLTDFEFTLQNNGITGVSSAKPLLTPWPDSWRLHDTLRQDLDLSVTLK